MSLESLVKEKYDDLNENDIYIWQYIYHHKAMVKKMSVQELAKKCNVSPTSIIRFARKLGLEGYSELKFHLKLGQENKSEFDRDLLHSAVSELKNTLKELEERNFDPVSKLIDEARNIFIYGTGEVQYNTALEIKREFAFRKKIMHIMEGYAEIDVVLQNVNASDVFIIISMSGNNDIAVTLARALKSLSVPTIGIGMNTKNLLSKHSTEYVGFTCNSFHMGHHDIEYTCVGHFYLICNVMFLKYLEYKELT